MSGVYVVLLGYLVLIVLNKVVMPLELDLFFLFLQWSRTVYPVQLFIFRVKNTYLNSNINPILGFFFPSKQSRLSQRVPKPFDKT